MKYHWGGRPQEIAFGTYPAVSLTLARDRRDEARQQLARDLNPRLEKKAARNAKTVFFAGVAEEWVQMMSGPAREEKAFTANDGGLEENCKAALDPATIKKHRWILDTYKAAIACPNEMPSKQFELARRFNADDSAAIVRIWRASRIARRSDEKYRHADGEACINRYS
jgi:hypothetical protein